MTTLKAGQTKGFGKSEEIKILPMAKELKPEDKFPPIPRVTVLKTVPSGEIRIERGADGAYLLFDCDCLDALPYCQAQCCSLKGIYLQNNEEEDNPIYQKTFHEGADMFELKKGCDGFCNHLDRESRTCSIYNDRPMTCRQFHCTRDHGSRGWKLPNIMYRLP